MNRKHVLSIAAGLALFACSCSTEPPAQPDLKRSVAAIQKYVDSFTGLSMEAARSRLAGAQVSEDEWKEGGFGGKELIGSFPEYEVRVFFSGDEVVTTSFQVLSK